MRREWLTMIVAIAAGCGESLPEPVDGGRVADAGMMSEPDAGSTCAGADDGTPCGAGEICLGEACTASVCGDGYVESPRELCDDGNDVNADGCTGCAYDCSTDAECADADRCDGAETCDAATHTCADGAPVECDDGDPCTADACGAAGACTETLIDGDGDGFAATSLGTCGTDCNDARADVYPGATELCDPVDHDCDGSPLPPMTPIWFVDCDGDDYATSGAASQVGCDRPAPSACGGSWTARTPSAGAIDCDDTNIAVRPGAAEVRADGVDQDCNGGELCFTDADDDGYYIDATRVSPDLDCNDTGEGALAEILGDCNDMSPSIRPNAIEIRADGVDQNCDTREACYTDEDDDGYYIDAIYVSLDLDCNDTGEGALSEMTGDCDDGSSIAHPGAFELCNGVDEDCSGSPTNGCPSTVISYGTATPTSSVGGTGGSSDLSSCPAGYAVSGFTGGAGALVDRVRALCRAYTVIQQATAPEYRYFLNAAMSSEMSAPTQIGGTGGTPFTARCIDGSVVTGISGRGGAAIDQLSFRCTAFDVMRSGGTWRPVSAGAPIIGPLGGTGGAPFTLNCPAGSVVQSVSGTRTGDNLVQSLTLRCAPITVVLQ